MTWDGRRTPARYRYAATGPQDTGLGSGTWVTIGGYSVPFPGFSSETIEGTSGVVVTHVNGVITANVNCWIDVAFYGEIDNDATGRRGARIMMDGVGTDSVNSANIQAAVTATPMRLSARYVGPLAAGHTLTVQAFQDSGSSLNLTWRQIVIDATAL